MNNKEDYYVYLHRRSDTNEVFYVGKGRGNRCYSKHSRNENWWKILEISKEFTVEYIEKNLSEQVALQLEETYIQNPLDSWNLVNKTSRNTGHTLHADELLKYFYYCETSPSCLRWKIKPCSRILKDDVAGSNSGAKWTVRFKGKLLSAHRVILSIHNIEVKGMYVDHLNGDPLDNRLLNLRVVSASENQHNLKLHARNTSGKTGVTYDKTRNRWRAQWVDISGKLKSKPFSCSKHGDEGAFALACEYRDEMIYNLNTQGAGYTCRHGT